MAVPVWVGLHVHPVGVAPLPYAAGQCTAMLAKPRIGLAITVHAASGRGHR